MAKTSAAVKNRYAAKAYDRFTLVFKKGDKDRVRDFAAAHGESLNGFIIRAIAELMERESTGEQGE